MVRLFIDAGRSSGIGPGDIVGAIANQADIPGKAIGAIDIYGRFTRFSRCRRNTAIGFSSAW